MLWKTTSHFSMERVVIHAFAYLTKVYPTHPPFPAKIGVRRILENRYIDLFININRFRKWNENVPIVKARQFINLRTLMFIEKLHFSNNFVSQFICTWLYNVCSKSNGTGAMKKTTCYNSVCNLLRIGPLLMLYYIALFPLMEAFPEFLFEDSHKLLDFLYALNSFFPFKLNMIFEEERVSWSEIWGICACGMFWLGQHCWTKPWSLMETL